MHEASMRIVKQHDDERSAKDLEIDQIGPQLLAT